MRKKHYHWTVPLTGMALFGTAVSAEQDINTYLDSTNRVTLSLRFGLNIHSKFSGLGGGFGAGGAAGNGRLTPFGDAYNYDNGYVLTTSSHNPNPDDSPNPNFTTYWGYDSASQLVGAPGAFTGVSLSRSTATGISGDQSSGGDGQLYPGLELTYDREFGIKENWHHMRYGLEGAVNYMKISLNSSGASGATVSTTTDIYNFPITEPDAPPFNDSGFAPGTALQIPASGSSTLSGAGTFLSQDHFNGDLWGFRLGPYVEFPMSEKWSLHLSGGLALGLLDDNEAWQQTLNVPGVGNLAASGGGSDFKMLWGYYVSLDASYQFNKRWGVEGGVQFQDIGNYAHSFSGRTVELGLNRSLFVQVGVSYSF